MQVPINALSPQALTALVEEYVTRDGTDYGAHERTLQDKKDAVLAQLQSGEAVVVFDV
ncbi:MAG: YheU family protein, partial [Myxococcota bacterium]